MWIVIWIPRNLITLEACFLDLKSFHFECVISENTGHVPPKGLVSIIYSVLKHSHIKGGNRQEDAVKGLLVRVKLSFINKKEVRLKHKHLIISQMNLNK